MAALGFKAPNATKPPEEKKEPPKPAPPKEEKKKQKGWMSSAFSVLTLGMVGGDTKPKVDPKKPAKTPASVA